MDVYDQLWANNKDVAEETLALPFFQHMQIGDLQADNYVMFTIQDIYYTAHVTDMLKEMSNKVKQPADLRNYFQDRYDVWNKYTAGTLKQFHLKGVSETEPIDAMQKYLSSYRDVMNQEDPIYFAVAILPGVRLWLWLSHHLHEGYGNAYFTWKKESGHRNPELHYRKLLDDHLKTKDQIAKANDIFRKHMQHEHDVFAASLKE